MRKPEITLNLGTAAGLGTWLVVTAIAFYLAAFEAVEYRSRLPLAAAVAIVNFVSTAFALRCGSVDVRARAALWAQLVSAFAFGALLPFSFMPIFTILWIAIAASFYSFRVCGLLLLGILVAWWLIETFVWNESWAILSVALYGTFHVFALLSARATIDADTAREEVEALNRELVATQHLLSEASRQNERTRIARDLHDLLGHHLTALSLNLQIAERQSEGSVKERIAESRALARLLLADVREAVTTLREEGRVDFARAVTLLVDKVPALDVHLEIEDGLRIEDVEVAESLLRCIQEAITNTLRHAGARSSWIRVWCADDRIHLEVVDDGELRGELREGNGFAGMRERLRKLGGALELDTAGDALRVRVHVPAAVSN
ncbi:MAG: histidine kinase [Woeseiaceae bacterium]|nr:histidine kinase [Woeseiaceae bacterium]